MVVAMSDWGLKKRWNMGNVALYAMLVNSLVDEESFLGERGGRAASTQRQRAGLLRNSPKMRQRLEV